MTDNKFKYCYGPVVSWRLGRSLGVDPISGPRKICDFDCAYCQLGKTDVFESERRIFVPTEAIISELGMFPSGEIDFVTLSGAGEPTLAKNLGEIIGEIKKIRKEPVAVITNSSLMGRRDVRDELCLADVVLAKVDASTADLFRRLNRPMPGIDFNACVEGLAEFRKIYRGRLVLQMMFIAANHGYTLEMASLAERLQPDEIQINTPLRLSGIFPLSAPELRRTTEYFRSYFKDKIKIWDVYEAGGDQAKRVDDPEVERRHGQTGQSKQGE